MMRDDGLTGGLIETFLLQRVSDGIVIADGEGMLVVVNPAALAMLSVTSEQCMGRTPREVFPQNPTLLNLFERKGAQKLDVRLPRSRIAQGIADDVAGGQRIVLLHDVTEKRNIDNRRVVLSRAIAHDLRNPISAIAGFADLVGRFGTLSDQQEKFLKRIRQTSHKLMDVIAMLVDLAWIEAGMPMEHAPIALDKVIHEAVGAIEVLAKKQGVGIATSIQSPLPVVMGDGQRLREAVYQILHNAVIYSSSDSNIMIHAWVDGDEVFCSVADRGIGIADDELELVFDRLYRSRDLRVEAIAGGGLGLTMVRTIVQRHGGTIWAASNLDEGSTFTFVLPAATGV